MLRYVLYPICRLLKEKTALLPLTPSLRGRGLMVRAFQQTKLISNISKRHADDSIFGRRVSVPQRYTEVEDDGDGFCFGGVVISVDRRKRRASILFDYTGERQTWPLSLVRQWCDPNTDPLCSLLEHAGLSESSSCSWLTGVRAT